MQTADPSGPIQVIQAVSIVGLELGLELGLEIRLDFCQVFTTVLPEGYCDGCG